MNKRTRVFRREREGEIERSESKKLLKKKNSDSRVLRPSQGLRVSFGDSISALSL